MQGEWYLELEFGVESSLLGVVDNLLDASEVEVLLVLEALDDGTDHVDDVHEHAGDGEGDDGDVDPLRVGGGHDVTEANGHGCDGEEVDRVNVLGDPVGIGDTLGILPGVCTPVVLLLDVSDVVEEASTYVCHDHDQEDLAYQLVNRGGVLLEVEDLLDGVERALDSRDA